MQCNKKLIRTLATAALTFSVAVPLSAQSSAPTMQLPAGIWTNGEDAYFAEEEGRETPASVNFEISNDRGWRTIDDFGKPLSEWSKGPIPGVTFDGVLGWRHNGSELRKARQFNCWAMLRKDTPKPDGSDDWIVHRNITLHDQGGRARVSGNGEAEDAVLRIRNVTWAKGSTSAPSLVLYIHKQDPVRAEAYTWSDTYALRLGVNLRWLQARCSPVIGAQPEPRQQ